MFTMKGDFYVYSRSHAVYYTFIVTEKKYNTCLLRFLKICFFIGTLEQRHSAWFFLFLYPTSPCLLLVLGSAHIFVQSTSL